MNSYFSKLYFLENISKKLGSVSQLQIKNTISVLNAHIVCIRYLIDVAITFLIPAQDF